MVELKRPDSAERRTVHLLQTLSHAADSGWGPTIRLALLITVTGGVGVGLAYIAVILR